MGSGFGHFLEAAAPHFSATGLELGPAAATRARARAGVSCTVGSVYAMPPALDGPFDAVTAWDFIEHVPDPIGALVAMAKAVRPGGHVFLSTPDARSAAARVLGRHWHYLDPVQHIVLFGRENLQRALERAGFEALAWRSFGHHYRLRYVFDRLALSPCPGTAGMGSEAGRALATPVLDRLVYVRLHDVLGVAALAAPDWDGQAAGPAPTCGGWPSSPCAGRSCGGDDTWPCSPSGLPRSWPGSGPSSASANAWPANTG